MPTEDLDRREPDTEMGSRAMCLLLVGALLSLALVRYAGAAPVDSPCAGLAGPSLVASETPASCAPTTPTAR